MNKKYEDRSLVETTNSLIECLAFIIKNLNFNY